MKLAAVSSLFLAVLAPMVAAQPAGSASNKESADLVVANRGALESYPGPKSCYNYPKGTFDMFSVNIAPKGWECDFWPYANCSGPKQTKKFGKNPTQQGIARGLQVASWKCRRV